MRRISVSLSDNQMLALKRIMEHDLAHNVSGYFGTPIARRTNELKAKGKIK